MKHSLELVFLAEFAISMIAVAASENNKTRSNSEAETESCTLLCCYNNTSFVAGKCDCEESATNATRQEIPVPKIYETDVLSRNISTSNITDNITYSVEEIYPQYIKNCITAKENKIYTQFLYYGMLISVLFLVATYVVYRLLPELRNVYGQSLVQYVGCLIVTNSIVGVTWLNRISIDEPYFLCMITSLAIIFTWVASFFWLNVMCFDIWWTLRRVRSIRGNVQQKKRKKFLIYSIYAWGGALVLTSVSVIVDFLPDIPETFRPNLCLYGFWFTGLGEVLYFWAPVSVIIIFNSCLFIFTARNIVHHKKDTTRHLKSPDSRCHIGSNNRELRFGVYLKLFIVMGMSWSFSVVSMIIDILSYCVPIYVRYIIVLPIVLQGIVIFILLVCKKKVMNLLTKRLSCRFCPRRNVTNSDCLSSFARTTTSGMIPLREVNLRS